MSTTFKQINLTRMLMVAFGCLICRVSGAGDDSDSSGPYALRGVDFDLLGKNVNGKKMMYRDIKAMDTSTLVDYATRIQQAAVNFPLSKMGHRGPTVQSICTALYTVRRVVRKRIDSQSEDEEVQALLLNIEETLSKTISRRCVAERKERQIVSGNISEGERLNTNLTEWCTDIKRPESASVKHCGRRRSTCGPIHNPFGSYVSWPIINLKEAIEEAEKKNKEVGKKLFESLQKLAPKIKAADYKVKLTHGSAMRWNIAKLNDDMPLAEKYKKEKEKGSVEVQFKEYKIQQLIENAKKRIAQQPALEEEGGRQIQSASLQLALKEGGRRIRAATQHLDLEEAYVNGGNEIRRRLQCKESPTMQRLNAFIKA